MSDINAIINDLKYESDEQLRHTIKQWKLDIKELQGFIDEFEAVLEHRATASVMAKYPGLAIAPDDNLLVDSHNAYFIVGDELYVKDAWSWKIVEPEPLICVSSGIIKEVPLSLVRQWRAAYLAQEATDA